MNEDDENVRQRATAILSAASKWGDASARWVAHNAAELVAVLGGYFVSAGVGAFNTAAGEITGGVLLVAGAVCLALSRGR